MSEEATKKREITRADIFYKFIPALLLVLGFFLIAMFLFDLTWGFILKGDIFSHRGFSFWMLTYPVTYNPVYLIIGVVISLIGVHLKNDRSWNRYRVILQMMCIILAVVTLFQIVSLAILANHSAIWNERSTLLNLYVMSSVTFIALLAVAIIEVPGVPGGIRRLLRKYEVSPPSDKAAIEQGQLPGLEPADIRGVGLRARFSRLLPVGLIALAVILIGVMVTAAVTTHEPEVRQKRIQVFYKGNADAEQLKTTERYLNKRMAKEGYSFLYVVLGPYGQAEVNGTEPLGMFLYGLSDRGAVQVRLVESKKKWTSGNLAFGTEQYKLDRSAAEPAAPISRTFTNYPGKEKFILDMGPSIFDNQGISDAKTHTDDWFDETVVVYFKGQASKQLKELAEKNMGKWVALLVDDSVKAVIPLDKNAAQGKFQTLPLSSPMEAKNLAAYLTTGPLPLEIVYKPE